MSIKARLAQQPLLLASDRLNTVILSPYSNVSSYTPFGDQRRRTNACAAALGFTGQYQESNRTYLLGHGYRAYNPRLMRFHSPDSLSPFNEGGLNGYAYCAGDPLNRHDPSGHQAEEWVGAGVMAGGLLAMLLGGMRGSTRVLFGGAAALAAGTAALTMEEQPSFVRVAIAGAGALALGGSVFGSMYKNVRRIEKTVHSAAARSAALKVPARAYAMRQMVPIPRAVLTRPLDKPMAMRRPLATVATPATPATTRQLSQPSKLLMRFEQSLSAPRLRGRAGRPAASMATRPVHRQPSSSNGRVRE